MRARGMPSLIMLLFGGIFPSFGSGIPAAIDRVLNDAANAFEVLELELADGLPGTAQISRACWHIVSREVHPDKHCKIASSNLMCQAAHRAQLLVNDARDQLVDIDQRISTYTELSTHDVRPVRVIMMLMLYSATCTLMIGLVGRLKAYVITRLKSVRKAWLQRSYRSVSRRAVAALRAYCGIAG